MTQKGIVITANHGDQPTINRYQTLGRDPKRVLWRSMGFRPIGDTRLNLASGIDYREGWINVDYHNPGCDVNHNLFTFPWPFPDASTDHILMDAYLEHVPHRLHDAQGLERDGAIITLEECWRILRPGGTLFIQVPYPGHYYDLGNIAHYRQFLPMTLGYLWGMKIQEPTSYESPARFELVKTRIRRQFGWWWFNNQYHIPKYLGFTLDWLGDKAMIAWVLRKPS